MKLRSSGKYSSIEKVERLVGLFETATSSRTEWTHAGHLVVALYYLTHHSYNEGHLKMRN
ncbi:MAG: hypothetical protein WKF34_10360 [Pyrinomonadaceae bacterium]